MNESALTGESVPVPKDEVVVLPEVIPVADRSNLAYSGTLVTTGSGAGIEVATGAETEARTACGLADAVIASGGGSDSGAVLARRKFLERDGEVDEAVDDLGCR